MSLTTPTEGNPTTPTGAVDQPISQTSGAGGQPLEETLKLVMERLDNAEKLVQSFQKGNDKQIGQVRNDLKRILELRDKGLDESQIQRELVVDSLINQTNAVAAPAGTQAAREPDFDVESTLKAMQFDDSDVALAALKVAYPEPKALLKAAANLRLQQLAVKPPGPAGALPPSGGRAAGGATPDSLRNEYNQRLDQLRKTGSANVETLTQLKGEFRKRGLEIW